MQFDLRKFITAGRQPYHAEFQCDLSAHDYAGARIPQPVTAVFDAETDGDEIRMTTAGKRIGARRVRPLPGPGHPGRDSRYGVDRQGTGSG